MNNALLITFGSIIVAFLAFSVFLMVLHYKSVKHLSEKILARSLGEVKSLEDMKPEDAYDVLFPKDDEVLAKEELVRRNRKLIQLHKEEKDLEKQMEKLKKQFG